jgi:CMP-N-acetylneuraminic acid synthetase
LKTVAFVPIKLNNERLPNKNILPLGDKPLCRHLLDTLTQVNCLDEIYVFCSDTKIQEYLPEDVKFLKRDVSLDTFTAKHYDIVRSFVSAVNADIYVNAHVTNPFIKEETIESGVKAILSGEYDSACAVSEIREHLWFEGNPFNFTLDAPPRTQDLKPLYAESGVFAYSKDVFAKTGLRYGNKQFFMILDKIESIDINYRDDYELAQALWILRNKTATEK